MTRIAILGCGWSGLVSSISLRSLYPAADVVCVDRAFDGGLLASARVGSYLFDVGGSHVVFSRRREVVKGIISMGSEWVSRSRSAYVLLDGFFVPYPFENGMYVLPPERRARYGISLIRALMNNRGERPANFLQWILGTFGEEVARDYLVPYNEKIWKRPLDEMSADWVFIPGRLPLPSLEDIVKAVAGLPTVGYAEQSTFYYPRRGGIYSQWRAAYEKAASLGVRFVKEEVREVRRAGSGFVVNGWLRADRIVNTLPLRDFVHMLVPEPPSEVLEAASRLDYNSVVVVGVGLRQAAPPHHWVYVPDRRYVFHRYAWISNYGEDVPSGRSALIAEVTVPSNTTVDLERVKADVLRGLSDLGVVEERAVEIDKAWFHRYGYPIYILTHGRDVATIEQYLTNIGIATFGRWGNWQYWNTDRIYEKAETLK
ncbi:MAG: protoporphyrinogen/coproporphyrinogen oxidase [Infirmifilum sp.]